MFLRMLPRADTESDGCTSGHISCTPSTAISGTDTGIRDPSTVNPSSPSNPRYMHDGPHRYIGIGMVVVMLTTAFLIWLYYNKCPRNEQGARDIRLVNCCGSRPRRKKGSQDDLESVNTKCNPDSPHDDKGKEWSQERLVKGSVYPLTMKEERPKRGRESKKPRFEEPQMIDLDADVKIRPLVQGRTHTVKEKRRPSGRRNPRGRHSGMHKEVVGGMVIYTEISSPPRVALAPGRDRQPRRETEPVCPNGS